MIQTVKEQARDLEIDEDFRFGKYREKDALQIIKGFQVLLPNGFDFSTRPAGNARYAVQVVKTTTSRYAS